MFVTACRRPMQTQARQISAWRGQRGKEASPLAGQLLATGSSWPRGSVFCIHQEPMTTDLKRSVHFKNIPALLRVQGQQGRCEPACLSLLHRIMGSFTWELADTAPLHDGNRVSPKHWHFSREPTAERSSYIPVLHRASPISEFTGELSGMYGPQVM